jgi:hypothetical protein
VTSEEEESPALSGKIQKKPARRCLKHLKVEGQQTSEEEESPVLSGKIQKKPARRCLKHIKVKGQETPEEEESAVLSGTIQQKPPSCLKAHAVDSDSAETQVTSESSDTSETKRIKVAEQAWQAPRPQKKSTSKPSAPKEDEISTQETSDSDESTPDQQTETPKPASSGLLDYCCWMVDQLSPEERQSAASKWWPTFAEFCGGMGSGIISFEGLRRAMATHHLRVRASCACLTEQAPWKASALKELLGCLNVGQEAHPCPIISRTGDLNNVVIRDFQDEAVAEKPTCHLLLMGIVCVDISNLTTTPKSVMDVEGESGRSLRELLQYLESLSFEDRPEGIILECVLGLSQKRKKGLPEPEVGTEQVSAALRPLGFIGAWEPEDAIKAYLPASRKRTWGIYLKVKMCGPNPLDAEGQRMGDISRAFSIVHKLKVPKHEPLETVVGRLGISWKATTFKTMGHPNMSMNWTKSAGPQKNMKRLGITPEDLLASKDLKAFWEATGSLMSLSCRRHALMKLASLRKKGKISDWRNEVLAFNADESAYRLGVGITHFPCVQPKRLHILSLKGKMVQADGKVCLAMQGIQSKELIAFPPLSKQTSKRQQDWAGNAFTVNICAAYILATTVVR